MVIELEVKTVLFNSNKVSCVSRCGTVTAIANVEKYKTADEEYVVYVYKNTGSAVTSVGRLTTGYTRGGDHTKISSYGDALALSGDGKVIAVGAPLANQRDGAVFIYRQLDQRYTLEQVLTPPVSGKEHGANFSTSMSMSSDGKVLVVGSPGIGKISIYRCRQENDLLFWEIESSVIPNSEHPGTMLGWSVAMSGDGNTVVAGAPSANTDGIRLSGTAYIYKYVNGIWVFNSVLVPDSSEEEREGSLYGYSVDVCYKGENAVVGAPGEGSSKKNTVGKDILPTTGAAYTYSYIAGIWVSTKAPSPRKTVPYMYFGKAVSMNGIGTYAAVLGDRGYVHKKTHAVLKYISTAYIYHRKDSAVNIVWLKSNECTAIKSSMVDASVVTLNMDSDNSCIHIGAIVPGGMSFSPTNYISTHKLT